MEEERLNLNMFTEERDSLNYPFDDSDRQWNILINQVIKGNVIPVIGSGMTLCEGEKISNKLVKTISKWCNMSTPAKNFSQLIPRFKVEFKNDDIYSLVFRILSNKDFSYLTTPSADLIKFLSIKYFPFVIYASFDSTVERAMKNIHGERLRVLTFDNNADSNDDIPALDDLKTPTLFYFFGKANDEGRRYVLGDKDILDFSRSWIAETDSCCEAKPANLSNALANKFLLVLGCEYEDWLFRFFWFAMKDAKIRQPEVGDGKVGMLGLKGTKNEELIEFLTRSNTLTHSIPIPEFVEQLCNRISNEEIKRKENMEHNKFDKPQEFSDVFLCYSHADKIIVERLYQLLTEMGLNVWYDKTNVFVGAEFWKDIRRAIRTTRIFVPVLTENIKKQYREEHIYRDEWEEAIIRKRRLGNVTYICPLCSEKLDLEDSKADIPETLKTHNVSVFQPDNFDDGLRLFANSIKDEILKLKEDEQL